MSVQFSSIKYIHNVAHYHYPFSKLFIIPHRNSVLIKQYIPTLPPQSPVTSLLLSVSMNLPILGPHVNGVMQYLPFVSVLFHLAWYFKDSSVLEHVSEFHSLLRLDNILSCIYLVLLIHSFVKWQLGCFHSLAIVNDAAVDTGVTASVWVLAFNSSVCMPTCGIVRSYGDSTFNFLRNYFLLKV